MATPRMQPQQHADGDAAPHEAGASRYVPWTPALQASLSASGAARAGAEEERRNVLSSESRPARPEPGISLEDELGEEDDGDLDGTQEASAVSTMIDAQSERVTQLINSSHAVMQRASLFLRARLPRSVVAYGQEVGFRGFVLWLTLLITCVAVARAFAAPVSWKHSDLWETRAEAADSGRTLEKEDRAWFSVIQHAHESHVAKMRSVFDTVHSQTQESEQDSAPEHDVIRPQRGRERQPFALNIETEAESRLASVGEYMVLPSPPPSGRGSATQDGSERRENAEVGEDTLREHATEAGERTSKDGVDSGTGTNASPFLTYPLLLNQAYDGRWKSPGIDIPFASVEALESSLRSFVQNRLAAWNYGGFRMREAFGESITGHRSTPQTLKGGSSGGGGAAASSAAGATGAGGVLIPTADSMIPRGMNALSGDIRRSLYRDPAEEARRAQELQFTSYDGFALFTVDVREYALTSEVHVFLGELLLRDGIYRSTRDASIHVVGLYEWKLGLLTMVGDLLHDSDHEIWNRLYSTFVSDRVLGRVREQALAKRNMSKALFGRTLQYVMDDYRRQFRIARRKLADVRVEYADLASLCRFQAHLAVEPAQYDKMGSMFSSLVRATQRPNYRFSRGVDLTQPSTDRAERDNFAPPAQKSADQASSPGSGSTTLKEFRKRRGSNSQLDSPAFFLRSGSDDTDALSGIRIRRQTSSSAALSRLERPANDSFVAMSGRITSENCHINVELKVTTLDADSLFQMAINYTIMVTSLTLLQMLILMQQMETASMPATASRVSMVSLGLQALADSYLCLCHLTLGITVQSLFNAFATAAFFKFTLFSIFEMRYMLIIWRARRLAAFSEGWEAMRRELSLLYTRFYGSLLMGVVLLYYMQNHLHFFLFLFYSFWVPQIVINATEDHRRPLHPQYIFGMTVTRSIIPCYFLACRSNFLHLQPHVGLAVRFFAWMMLQACMLYSQHVWGSRWFIPKRFLPEKYDYYRPVSRAEHGAEVTDVECGGGAAFEVVDCVICMVPVNLNARSCMTAPCHHIFHEDCLQQWMDRKMECPVCRRALPVP
ncbi:Transmembrane E3 ubiquitin-protein ligase 1 [Porphyridium purpureum]|uniref:RING-type E3 ubiquitin transferase n=1 Tax=Porphyridium purpureum TaxID=35688 RepID=A0A5J4Z8G2_PORPP|nr:Transmembrane E3 ubiquitin-protein ligase 1 [Porphyridium purpureum]|eukprot:POR4198..scf295_1